MTAPTPAPLRPAHPSFGEAFLYWLKLGFISFGGPAGQIAIVVFAAWRIGSRALKNKVLWALAAASFIAIFAFDLPFPYIVLAAGILGFIGGKLMPGKFKVGGGHGASDKKYGPALIDDDTPPLGHTRFRWTYLITLLFVALALWGAAMALLECAYVA